MSMDNRTRRHSTTTSATAMFALIAALRLTSVAVIYYIKK